MWPALHVAALVAPLLLLLLPPPCAAVRPQQQQQQQQQAQPEQQQVLQASTGEELHRMLLRLTDGTPFVPGVVAGATARALARDAALVQAQPRLEVLSRPDYDTVPAAMPWDAGVQPLARCPGPEGGRQQRGALAEQDKNLKHALGVFCGAGLGSLVEFYVDPRFQGNYERLRGSDGWIDKAYLTYMGLKKAHDNIGGEEDLLVQSVHHFSTQPVVVANFNERVPKGWTPEKFPRLVLMQARSTQSIGKSFNFNKFTAMLFTKVKAGMVLDADQFANHGLDSMLQRAAEETTREYPYPIMPVHWMSRDPGSDDMNQYPPYYSWVFKSSDAPKRSMRWGHAHPTWTHHALPWLAKWTSYALAPDKTSAPQWLKDQGWVEDEDLMNVGLWADNATKQWCKYDIPSPSEFGRYIAQSGQSGIFRDSKYFPKGIAYVYFTAHDAKKPEESYDWLARLWDDKDDRRKAILYDGRWFGSGAALKAYDRDLRCIA